MEAGNVTGGKPSPANKKILSLSERIQKITEQRKRSHNNNRKNKRFKHFSQPNQPVVRPIYQSMKAKKRYGTQGGIEGIFPKQYLKNLRQPRASQPQCRDHKDGSREHLSSVVDKVARWLPQVSTTRTAAATATTPSHTSSSVSVAFPRHISSPYVKKESIATQTQTCNSKSPSLYHPSAKSVAEIVSLVIKNYRPNDARRFIGENRRGNDDKTINSNLPRWSTNADSMEARLRGQDFERMKIIGQVETKFIIGKAVLRARMSYILFDQHAVHEYLLYNNCEAEIQEKAELGIENLINAIDVIHIDPPLQLEFPDKDLRILAMLPEYFQMIGIKTQVPIIGNSVTIHSAPSYPMKKIADEMDGNSKKEDVMVKYIQNSIQELLLEIVAEYNNGHHPPRIPTGTFAITRIKACQGAVKLGENLDIGMCKNLIHHLSKLSQDGLPLARCEDFEPGIPTYVAQISCGCREDQPRYYQG